MKFYDLIGFVLIFVQVGLLLPIIGKLLKTSHVKGISLWSEAFWVAAGIGWGIYGLLSTSYVLAISGFTSSFGGLFVVYLVAKKQKFEKSIKPLVAALLLLFLFLVLSWIKLEALSFALSVFGVVQFLPQLFTSWRAIKSRMPVEGVSPSGSALRVLYTASWGLWALVPPVKLPLAVWGWAGVLAFGLQFISTRGSLRKSSNSS